MSKTLRIANVPDELHSLLAQRAARAGLSLEAYALRELESTAQRMTESELRALLLSRTPVVLDEPLADLVRESREEREQQMDAWSDDRR